MFGDIIFETTAGAAKKYFPRRFCCFLSEILPMCCLLILSAENLWYLDRPFNLELAGATENMGVENAIHCTGKLRGLKMQVWTGSMEGRTDIIQRYSLKLLPNNCL